MKIARYEAGGGERLGAVDGDVLRPLPAGTDLLALLAAEPGERERAAGAAEPQVPLDGVRLRSPLHPASIRDFSVFEAHIEGMVKNGGPDETVPADWYEWPWFYFSNPHSVVGPGDPVEVPPGCELLDFELELAAVIGKPGRNLTPEQAREHIAAYTILNDWSARDIGFREFRTGFGQAKGKDFAVTLGPWLVTADELEPYRQGDRLALQMTAFRNGELVGSDTSAAMAWSFEELVSFASRGAWVAAGDVIGSGTCGSGCLAELWGRNGRREPRPLAPGDVVELTIEGIGTIANEIVAGGEPAPPLPRARTTTKEAAR
jgi:2-keto-4-pentenoate hydratase/2-oxohepta-3-ene-1,7-dioic acid hydratase in catechol pathway